MSGRWLSKASALAAVDDIPITSRYLDIVFSLYSLGKGCSNCTVLLGQETQENIGIAADSRIAGRCSILEQEKVSIRPKPERVCHSFGDRVKASPSNCLPYKIDLVRRRLGQEIHGWPRKPGLWGRSSKFPYLAP